MAGATGATATAAPRVRFPRSAAAVRRYEGAPTRLLVEIGQMVWFALTAVGQIPYAVRRYPKELLRLVAQMGMG
ncbi:MAG: ABC transporter permease, partial [Mycobacterium sp.]